MTKKQSVSQQALEWMKANPDATPYAAAKKFGLSPNTIYTAITRMKQRGEIPVCKCCGQVIRG